MLQTQKSSAAYIAIANISWLPIIGLWVVFVGLIFHFAQSSTYGLKAFEVYFNSADNLVTQFAPIYQGTSGWIYLYPPLLSQLLMPVAYIMDYQAASHFWLSLNISLLIISLIMIQRYVPARWNKVLWVLPVVFVPVWQAMYIGQVTILMLALLTAIWVAIREGHGKLAGYLLAFAAWIKVFPAVLVIYFLYKRNWQVLLGTLIGGMALLFLQVAISGPELMINFFEVLYNLTKDGQPSATFENLSIFGFASRLFQENTNVIPMFVNEQLFTLCRWGMIGIVMVVTAVAVHRSNTRSRYQSLSWRFDIEYALVILTMLLMGSTLWISGLPPMILIGVLIIRHRRHQQNRQVRLLWITAFILIVAYQPMIVLLTLFNIKPDALTLSIGFSGLMLTWGLMVWLLAFEPEPNTNY